MPRKPSKGFTDRELEIMKVVWQMGEATVKEIQQRLPGHPHYNSVLTIIRVLERKGRLVHRVEGKTHFYRAGESKEKSRTLLLRHLIDQVFGGSAASIVLNLVQTGDLTPKDIDDIRSKIAGVSEEKKEEKKDDGKG
jgi:BlaI family transcriptional regulator, penicillinase repressor